MISPTVEQVVEEGLALTDVHHRAPAGTLAERGKIDVAYLALCVDSVVLYFHIVYVLLFCIQRYEKKAKLPNAMLKFLNVHKRGFCVWNLFGSMAKRPYLCT